MPFQETKEEEAETDSDEDMEKALQKERDKQTSQPKRERRFQQFESGANNCVFIKTTLDNPVHLVDSIFTDVLDSQKAKSRYIMRFLPIVGTCKCIDENITRLAEKTLKEHFTNADGHSFIVHVKCRNNSVVKRSNVIRLLVEAVRGLNPANQPDLDNPEYVIGVDVIKNIMCISVQKYFTKFRKYNLQEITLVKETKKNTGTEDEEVCRGNGGLDDDVTQTCEQGEKSERTVVNLTVGNTGFVAGEDEPVASKVLDLRVDAEKESEFPVGSAEHTQEEDTVLVNAVEQTAEDVGSNVTTEEVKSATGGHEPTSWYLGSRKPNWPLLCPVRFIHKW